jgi:MFS family permease
MKRAGVTGGGTNTFDSRYEVKVVALTGIGMGLVILDRFIINPLFPVMSPDLGLSYEDLGLISAVLALAWGIASIVTGRLSDRIGQKRVMIPAVLVFSLLAASSGLASGLASLLVIRGLMGLAEGAFVPASIVATVKASKPSRVGLNTGMQQLAAPLFDQVLGPILVVTLLKVLPSWRWVFGVVPIPGLFVAAIMAKVLRGRSDAAPRTRSAPPRLSPAGAAPALAPGEQPARWAEILRYRNVIFNALGMSCYLACVMVMSAFMPNYLTDHLALDLDRMGMVLTGQGMGAIAGMALVPALSDRLGRKPVMLTALAVMIGMLWLLPSIGPAPGTLFAALFLITGMNAGIISINIGPLTSGSVPRHLATTATGIVVGIGEVLGGAVAPAFAGAMAQRHGIVIIPQIALAAAVLGILICAFGVREPRAAPDMR